MTIKLQTAIVIKPISAKNGIVTKAEPVYVFSRTWYDRKRPAENARFLNRIVI